MRLRSGRSGGLRLIMALLKVWALIVLLPALTFFGLFNLNSGVASASGQVLTNQGGYAWPVQGPATSSFGLRRSPDGPGTEFHTGLDVAAPAGTPVHAAAAGRVVLAQTVGRYGNLVILEHQGPDGAFETWYGHLSGISVSRGVRVEQGQVVGLVGSTGRSTGSHLHFEYRDRGRPLDPYVLYR